MYHVVALALVFVVLRGVGVTAVKSAELLPESLQPPFARRTDLLTAPAGLAVPSEQFAAP